MVKLVSVHLPKTAGTSFGDSIAAAYNQDVRLDYADRPINQPRDVRLKQAEMHNKATPGISEQAIHGHFLPAKYAYLSEQRSVRFVTWLREPVSRLKSHYCFWRDTPAPAEVPPLRKRMLEEKWTFLEFATEPALQNMYQQFFEGFDMKRFDFIGITERYEQDLLACASLLRVTLEVSQKNTARQAPGLQISDVELNTICDFHQGDIKLYCDIVERRMTRMK